MTFGMTLKQVETALGSPLVVYPDSYGSYIDCETGNQKDGRDPALSFMLEHGKLTRIDVLRPENLRSTPNITATTGIGVGSTEAAVKRAYGATLRVEPHTDFNLIEVFDLDKQGGIIFETEQGRVTSFRAGKEPSIEYSEGCE